MTTIDQLQRLAADEWTKAPAHQWWKHKAADCLAQGHVQIIPGRRAADVYLLRCWLSVPRRLIVESSRPDDGARFESGDSLLLHHFLQPDDDGALHDHPWDFITEGLAGGYYEQRPMVEPWSDVDHGPTETRVCRLRSGQTNVRRATDLHSIVSLEPDTWTLMRTGPRVRSWFFHPPGKPRVPWSEYLAALGKDVPAPRDTAAAS